MEYIAIATGPNKGLYMVNTRKQRRTLLNNNAGESVKCGNIKNEVELWYMQHTETLQKERSEEPENGYIGFKKDNEAIALAYETKGDKSRLIKEYAGWDYGVFKKEQEVLDWTECKELNVRRVVLSAEEFGFGLLNASKPFYETLPPPKPFALDPVTLPPLTEKAKKSDDRNIMSVSEITAKQEEVKIIKKAEEQAEIPEETEDIFEDIEAAIRQEEKDMASFTAEDLKEYEEQQIRLLERAEAGIVDLPTVRIGDTSRPFLQWYYEEGGNMAAHGLFAGHVYSISQKGVILTRVSVMFKDGRGETVVGKEDHVWLKDTSAVIASKAKEGSNISFRAKAYAYKRQDGTLDYSLTGITDVTKINSYFVPTELSLQKLYLEQDRFKTYNPTDCQVIESLNQIKNTLAEMKRKEKTNKKAEIVKETPKKIRPKAVSFCEDTEKQLNRIEYQCPYCQTSADMDIAKYCCGCGQAFDWSGLLKYLPV